MLYVVALSHVNAFIFSQDAAAQVGPIAGCRFQVNVHVAITADGTFLVGYCVVNIKVTYDIYITSVFFQEVESARQSMLRKIYYLTNEVPHVFLTPFFSSIVFIIKHLC